MLDLLKRPEVSHRDISALTPDLNIDSKVSEQIEIDVKYAGYIERQQEDIDKLRRHENTAIPASFDYDKVSGLSNEVKQKLNDAKPETLARASRIPGVTPAAISLIIGVTKEKRGLIMSSQTIQQELELGIQTLGLNCSAYQQQQLLTYLEMLQRWNKAYNLTAIREPIQMVRLHLLDSLAIHPYIQGVKNIIDVGTGPGLPGIPLAILNPDINFTLLDSNGKKTRFLFQAINDLSLANAKEVNQRVEKYQSKSSFDIVVSRAFSSISDMLNQCDHLVSKSGCFLAMKGKKPDSELSQITKNYKVVDLSQVNVPKIDSERHLIKIIKTDDSV